MNKTDWFPGDVKPVHRGVYLTRDEDDVQWLNYWNGYQWGWGSRYGAHDSWPRESAGCASFQHRKWCGQTEQTTC